jgi:hypothetical protein
MYWGDRPKSRRLDGDDSTIGFKLQNFRSFPALKPIHTIYSGHF